MIVRAYRPGRHGKGVPIRYLVLLLFYIGAVPHCLAEEGPPGDFGYRLGAVLESRNIEHRIVKDNKTATYGVKRLSGDRYYENIQVTVSDDARIVGIVAYGPSLKAGICGKHQQEKLNDLQNKYPGWQYYAAGDADLLYTDKYSVLLGCEESAESTYLKLEYVYDAEAQGSDR